MRIHVVSGSRFWREWKRNGLSPRRIRNNVLLVCRRRSSAAEFLRELRNRLPDSRKRWWISAQRRKRSRVDVQVVKIIPVWVGRGSCWWVWRVWSGIWVYRRTGHLQRPIPITGGANRWICPSDPVFEISVAIFGWRGVVRIWSRRRRRQAKIASECRICYQIWEAGVLKKWKKKKSNSKNCLKFVESLINFLFRINNYVKKSILMDKSKVWQETERKKGKVRSFLSLIRNNDVGFT